MQPELQQLRNGGIRCKPVGGSAATPPPDFAIHSTSRPSERTRRGRLLIKLCRYEAVYLEINRCAHRVLCPQSGVNTSSLGKIGQPCAFRAVVIRDGRLFALDRYETRRTIFLQRKNVAANDLLRAIFIF
ncbi:hypothetical protein EVAR_51325_1 [Eumeta japonica]|uniref:Uncharacterized protein n=1 Tax=Eumeta variegata TaxID=151549 RepID=A0A4C1XZU4_EUMVA|nr:hypothetical protein EVAR_51325_1 [Eumeta japonica]